VDGPHSSVSEIFLKKEMVFVLQQARVEARISLGGPWPPQSF